MSNLFWKSRPFLALVGLALVAAPAWSQQPAPVSPPAPAAGSDAASYVKLGEDNGKNGNLDAAIEAFSKAIQIDPKCEAAYEDRGKALSFQHKLPEAIANFDQALQIDPNDKDALNRRGGARGQTGDFDGAIADFSRLIVLAPQFGPAYYNRGHAKYFKGDLDGALKDLDQALSLDQNSPFSYFIRGLIRHARNDTEGTLADFQKSTGFGYSYAAFWVWIAQTEQGKGDIAKQTLTESLTKPELFKPEDWGTTIGNFLLGKVTQDDLIAKAGQGDGAQERLCEAWFYSGMVKRLAGDKAGAQDCFTKAVATGSKSSEEFVEANRALAAMAQPPSP